MRKIISIFLTLLFSINLAFAYSKVDLSEHGSDLMKAPFVARQKFSYTYHRDWMNSTYNQRQEFLTAWHIQNIADAKAARARAKEIAQAKKAEDKKRLDKLKAKMRDQRNQERAQKAKEKAENDKRKAFDKIVSDQKRELQRLQRLQ